MLRHSIVRNLPAVGVAVLFLLVWDLAVRIAQVQEWLLPAPMVVLTEFFDAASSRVLVTSLVETIVEVLLGFGTACLLAALAASLMAWSRWLERGIYPLLILIQTLPVIALTPLVVVWLGLGLGGKLAVVTVISFFPLTVGASDGLKSVEPALTNMFRIWGANRLQIFTKLDLPSAMPSIFSGAKVAVVTAVVGAFVAEYAFGNTGLGHLIKISAANFHTPRVFASILLLCLVAIALFTAVKITENVTLRKYSPTGRK